MNINSKDNMVPDVKIVAATPEMLDDILKIEKQSFSTPWTENDFLTLMNRDYSDIIVAVTKNKKVTGYGCISTVFDETEILNIAVDKSFRRMGTGSLLIQKLMELSQLKGGKKIYLEVRRSNITAQRLYSSFNFAESGYRRNYYKKPSEDAIIMVNDCLDKTNNVY